MNKLPHPLNPNSSRCPSLLLEGLGSLTDVTALVGSIDERTNYWTEGKKERKKRGQGEKDAHGVWALCLRAQFFRPLQSKNKTTKQVASQQTPCRTTKTHPLPPLALLPRGPRGARTASLFDFRAQWMRLCRREQRVRKSGDEAAEVPSGVDGGRGFIYRVAWCTFNTQAQFKKSQWCRW